MWEGGQRWPEVALVEVHVHGAQKFRVKWLWVLTCTRVKFFATGFGYKTYLFDYYFLRPDSFFLKQKLKI
jgi:hypothetical protein